jgi:hypothetical protein
MKKNRGPGWFTPFRRSRFAGVWLAMLLLAVPFIQPLSEANAAGKPFAAVICSAFGSPGGAVLPGLADDCPACIAGQHTSQFTISGGALPADILVPAFRSGASDFPSPIALPAAASQWKIKPPGHAPPLGI